jgi:DNA-binding NarL/FixJ family response regulator
MATIDINEAQMAQGAKAGSGSAADGTQAIRVAMLDDQPLFIDGVEMAIEHSGDMTMVLRSGSVDHLLHALSRVDADILLMEPWVRSGDGLDGVAAVKAHHPSVAIIALSHWSDAAHVKQVVAKAGGKLTGFARFQLGEGIEKAATDFAAEVAAAAKG